MSKPLAQQKFDVHLFAVVRHKISAINAVTHREAVKKALEQIDLAEAFHHPNGGYADELAHFLVDVVGDEQFANSQWFPSRDNSLLSLLEEFITWHESGQQSEEGERILHEARQALANSL